MTEYCVPASKTGKTDYRLKIDHSDNPDPQRMWQSTIDYGSKNSCLPQTQTINTRLNLLQYHWLMRTYLTPVQLYQKFR